MAVATADIWVRFAAAAISNGEETPSGAGELADRMMAQFYRRFEYKAGDHLRGSEWWIRDNDTTRGWKK